MRWGSGEVVIEVLLEKVPFQLYLWWLNRASFWKAGKGLFHAENVNPKTGNNLPHLRSEWVEEMPQCGTMKKWCVRTEWYTVKWERQSGVRWCKLKPMWSSLRAVSHSHSQKHLKINSVLNLVLSKKSSSSISNLNFSNSLYPFRTFQSYN